MKGERTIYGNNFFDSDVKFGNKWEKRLVKIFNNNGFEALKGLIKHTPYKEYKDLQKMGIDAKIEVPLQIKTRREGRGCYYMNDVLFEFTKAGKPGTHKNLLKMAIESNYETVPIFVYVWTDNEGNVEEKGIWIAYNKEFCDWITGEGMSLLKEINPAGTYTSYNHQWVTKNKVLPLHLMRDHPKKHLVNTFDTLVTPKRKWKQTTLDGWL